MRIAENVRKATIADMYPVPPWPEGIIAHQKALRKAFISPVESEVAKLWILAALTLPFQERVMGMQDIADMLETTYARVQSKASRLRAEKHTEATITGYGESRLAYIVAPFRPGHKLPPSELQQPSKADLTGARARTRQRDKTPPEAP